VRRIILVAALGLLAAAGAADAKQAEQRVTRLVSVNPAGVTGAFGACTTGYQFPRCRSSVSSDGKTVTYMGADQALYRSRAGKTELVSVGATGVVARDFADGFCARRHACTFLASNDGNRIYFETQAALTLDDTDTTTDIYAWAAGALTLVTKDVPPGAWPLLNAVSPDGARVFYHLEFHSDDGALCCNGIYEWSAGKVHRFPSDAHPLQDAYQQITFRADGSTFFTTEEALLPEDRDSCASPYVPSERRGCPDVYRQAPDGTLELISTGPSAQAGDGFEASFNDAGKSGDWAIFTSAEQLVPGADGGGVYERRGGVTTLVGPGGRFLGASADGRRVFFATSRSLTPADTDSCLNHTGPRGCEDVYEFEDGKFVLVSSFIHDVPDQLYYLQARIQDARVSSDGSKLLFTSVTSFAAEDADACPRGNGEPGCLDVYEWSGGAVRLVSTGPSDANEAYDSFLVATNQSLSRVLFTTNQSLVPEDGDAGNPDIYERVGGSTLLVSTGPTESNDSCTAEFSFQCVRFIGASDGLGTVVFQARARLTPDDADDWADLYSSIVAAPGCAPKTYGSLPKKCS
jgi:hypothetical protein